MLHKVTRIQGMPIAATDGEIGAVADLYFDDERWAVRYLVVDTGGWMGGRQVLISPRAIRHGEWIEDAVRVDLARAQVRESPSVDTAKPVSRRYEITHAAYYGYPHYWNGPYLWGQEPYPGAGAAARHAPPEWQGRELRAAADAEREAAERSHLRSAVEVIGYDVAARDGRAGRVDDLLIDDETWGLPYLVVDSRTWIPGGRVLVPPDAVAHIDWATSSVRLTLTRESVKAGPAYA